MPSPCPSTLEVNVIQLTGLVARHAHSRATAIVIVPEPPDELNDDAADDDTVASQRVDVSKVGPAVELEVVAELPHAAVTSVSAAPVNSSGRRVSTGSGVCTIPARSAIA